MINYELLTAICEVILVLVLGIVAYITYDENKNNDKGGKQK